MFVVECVLVWAGITFIIFIIFIILLQGPNGEAWKPTTKTHLTPLPNMHRRSVRRQRPVTTPGNACWQRRGLPWNSSNKNSNNNPRRTSRSSCPTPAKSDPSAPSGLDLFYNLTPRSGLKAWWCCYCSVPARVGKRCVRVRVCDVCV